jgi:hypothetical protein
MKKLSIKKGVESVLNVLECVGRGFEFQTQSTHKPK